MRHAALNKTYCLIWNAAHQCWQAVSETARGKSKGASAVIVSSLLLVSYAFAAPTGGVVTAGQA